MHRRQFLASVSVTVLFGGCTGRPGSSDTPTPTAAESPTHAPASKTASDGQPADAVLRSELRYVHNVDAIGVDPPERDQFAFVLHPEYGIDLPPDEFGLELGDEEFSPRTSIPGFMLHTPGVENVYTEDDRSGRLVFDVPTTEAETGALVGDGMRYPHSADALAAFAAAPDFTLQSVSVPETVSSDESLSVSVTVENDGEREGTFLAGIQRGGLFKTIEVSVPPGEAETTTVRLELFADAGESEYLRFVYAGEDERFEVLVEDDE